MINFLIDGNYIFHKTLGIVTGYGIKGGTVLEKKADQAIFARKIVTDLAYMLTYFGKYNRVFFTKDSKSWRKEIEIEDGGYKSGRKHDEEVNWDVFYEMFDQLGEYLISKGICFSSYDRAEGDDIIYFWSRYLNMKGENCMILSGDGDLTQAVNLINDKCWTIHWTANNKNNNLFVPLGFLDFLKKSPNESNELLSIFDKKEDDDSVIISNFIHELKNELNVVEKNPEYLSFRKILQGDKGDSIPSVWFKKSIREKDKKEVVYSLSDGKFDKVEESIIKSGRKLDPNLLLEDEEYREFLSGLILRIFSEVDNKENRAKCSENIVRNTKLVWLNKKVIPSDILKGLISNAEENILKSSKKLDWNSIKLLEGTDWCKENSSPMDPFDFYK